MLDRRPVPSEYNPYYEGYVNKVVGTDFIHQLRNTAVFDTLDSLSPILWAYRYAPEKWSIKEMVQHLIDTERVFAYRALRIGRNDKTPMAGFDQDPYVEAGNADQRSARSLLDEWSIVRGATVALYDSFGSVELERVGVASDSEISVLALGYMILGHQLHHMDIINERYMTPNSNS